MYKIAGWVVILFIFSLLELTVLYDITIAGVKPLLLWLGVVFIAMWEKEIAGLTFGILAGILADFSSGGCFGLNAVSFGLGGYLVGRFWMKFVRESPFTQIVIAFLSSMFHLFLYWFFASIFSPFMPLQDGIKRVILPTSIYTAVIAPPIFGLLNRFYSIIKKLEVSHVNSKPQADGKALDETEYLEPLD